MEMIGSVGIIQNDHEWEAEAERFDCPCGHSILVVETNRIEGLEGYDPNDGHGLSWRL